MQAKFPDDLSGRDLTDTDKLLGSDGTNDAVNINGSSIATRDSTGKIPLSQLPSNVANNKGWFATPTDLQTAIPTGENGWFAIVASTDTIWVWGGSANQWKDSDTKGQVSSVNGEIGTVILTTDDIPEGSNLYFTDARAINAVQPSLDLKADQTALDSTNDLIMQVSESSQDADAVLQSQIDTNFNDLSTVAFSGSYKDLLNQPFATGDYKQSSQSADHGSWLICQGGTASRTTYSALKTSLTISTTGNITSGSTTISNIPSTGNLLVGSKIEGAGIPANATIATIPSSTSITISAAATITGTAVAITIFPFGNGDGSTTFNLPDFRGRVFGAIGTGTGLTARASGVSVGAETVTLSAAQSGLPAHSHAATSVLTTDGAAVDRLKWASDNATGNTGGERRLDYRTPYTAPNGAISTSISSNTAQNATAAHENMQPTLFAGNVFVFSGI